MYIYMRMCMKHSKNADDSPRIALNMCTSAGI